MPKPGTSVSISITEPIDEGDDAADAERRRSPGTNTSATMKADAEQDQREAGVVHRQQLQGVEREQQADRAHHARQHEPGFDELEDQP